MVHHYRLLSPDDKNLNTHMELATLFFEHCRRVYLQPQGTIAFVMPRSVIIPSKQHRSFQQQGFSRILDFKDVAPLFNVETCIIIHQNGDTFTEAVPTVSFSGKLPAQECKLAKAAKNLAQVRTYTHLPREEKIAAPYYHACFKQGATLVPRNLAFVTSAQPDLQPNQLSYSSVVCTDLTVNHAAKAPWKNLRLEGHVNDEFLYATLLSKNLLPFGIGRFSLVALPIVVARPSHIMTLPGHIQESRFIPWSLARIRNTFEVMQSAAWFDTAENLRKQLKETKGEGTLFQRFNYQNLLLAQSPEPGFLVLYGASGTNLAAAVVNTHKLPLVNNRQPQAFVVDHTTYWYRSSTAEEAYFLAALLNAPCVDNAIKKYQTRGLYGERHIHRRPFEICAIPRFDPCNSNHQELASLSREAHILVDGLDPSMRIEGKRRQVRLIAGMFINQMNAIVEQMLGLTSER